MDCVTPVYGVLTPGVVKSWSDGDGVKTLTANVKFEKKKTDSENETGKEEFYAVDRKKSWDTLYELCWRGVDGSLKTEDIVSSLKNTFEDSFFKETGDGKKTKKSKKASYNALEVLLVDVLWYISQEVSHGEGDEGKQLSPEWKCLCELVARLSSKKVVQRTLFEERLDFEAIEGSKTCNAPAKILRKRMVKANTLFSYRQQKYNMLAEESEGFSKLIVELQKIDKDNVEIVRANILSLIGYFHLDPSRVFDIILDLYENDPSNSALMTLLVRKNMFRMSNLQYLLRFKYRMYHPPAVDSETDNKKPSTNLSRSEAGPTPQSLYRITTVLITGGALSIEDVLPHLYPPDSQLLTESAELRAHTLDQSKKVGKGVGLQTTGKEEILKKEEERRMAEEAYRLKIKIQEERNQKYGLVATMLAVNCWDDACILINHLQNAGVNEAILDHSSVKKELINLIDRLLDPVYRREAEPMILYRKKRKLKLSGDALENFVVSQELSTNGKSVAPVQTLSEVLSVVGPMLCHLGHRIAESVMLINKVCRIFYCILTKHPEICNLKGTNEKGSKEQIAKVMLLKVVGDVLLPSLPLLDSPMLALVNELWKVLAELPYKIRFDLYEKWRSHLSVSVPVLVLAKADARWKTKQVLKRIAKERSVMRLAGRKFAKVAHNNPITAFTALLENVQSYDNLIPIVVDSLRYITPFGFDVLAYLLIVNLARDEAKVKSDGTSHSHWLQSLCKFTGNFYQRNHHVEICGLFNYLLRQLKLNKPLDLLILEEVVAKMVGLEIVEDFSHATLRAMGGSDRLRTRSRAALDAGTSTRKKSVSRLKDVLDKGNYILPLLIEIAQQRNTTLYPAKSKNGGMETQPLKLIGHSYDKCTSTLIQFSEFLSMDLSISKYRNILPNLSVQCLRYHVEPVVAFHISRSVMKAIRTDLRDSKKQLSRLESELEKVSSSKGEKKDEIKDSKDKKAKEIEEIQAKIELMKKDEWMMGSKRMLEMCEEIIGDEKVWEVISSKLYAHFWSLSLYDVLVPKKQYDVEVTRVEDMLNTLKNGGDIGTGKMSTKKRNNEIGRCEKLVKGLKDDVDVQYQNYKHVVKRFTESKKDFFPTNKTGKNLGDWKRKVMMVFVQTCILPRVLFSAEDALYCAQFGKLLHKENIPGFSTIEFFRITASMLSNIFCTTEREANNLAVYTEEVLSYIVSWTKDRKTFAKECQAHCGFSETARDKSSKHSISFDDFSKMVDRTFEKMTALFVKALKSKDYMKIRPALIVCSKIVASYPRKGACAFKLKEVVSELAKEDRQDIKIMAKRYMALLEKKIREEKTWVVKQPSKPQKTVSNKTTASATVSSKRKAPLTTNLSEKKVKLSSSLATSKAKSLVDKALDDESDGEIPEADEKVSDVKAKDEKEKDKVNGEELKSKPKPKPVSSIADKKHDRESSSSRSRPSKRSRASLESTANEKSESNKRSREASSSVKKESVKDEKTETREMSRRASSESRKSTTKDKEKDKDSNNNKDKDKSKNVRDRDRNRERGRDRDKDKDKDNDKGSNAGEKEKGRDKSKDRSRDNNKDRKPAREEKLISLSKRSNRESPSRRDSGKDKRGRDSKQGNKNSHDGRSRDRNGQLKQQNRDRNRDRSGGNHSGKKGRGRK